MSDHLHCNAGDFITWSEKHAQILQESLLLQLDMGWLLSHLLEWQRLPERRGDRLGDDIAEQRNKVASRIREMPDLEADLQEAEWWAGAWGEALDIAAEETGLLCDAFPENCPWAFEQIMDPDFWPSSPAGDT